jgi:hypothetical protein
MKRSERSPYARVATEADKQAWLSVFAPIALVGFVQATESGVTHWAAVIRNRRVGRSTKHALHRLCDRREITGPTPAVEVSCITCIVRIEKGPRVC